MTRKLSVSLLRFRAPLSTRKDLRPVHDTIGFTKYNWQFDSIYNRLGIKDSKNNKRKKAL
jgi:hypothetical protein